MSIKTTANALATAAGLPTGQRTFAVTGLALVDASGAVVFDAVKIKNGDPAALSALQTLLGFVVMPSGALAPYAGTAAPTGWLLCDGAAVSRTTYAALFAITGTAFGVGNGTTTFNLPDLRGRVPAGLDNMGSGAASRLTGATRGAALGTETHVLSSSEMPSHTHTGGAHTHTYDKASQLSWATDQAAPGNGVIVTVGDPGPGISDYASTDSGSAGAVATTATGGGAAHTSVQPTLCVNYIIKT